MLRKSAISLAVIGALHATHASALGLGEMQVSSALNQPFKAEIDLLQLRGLNASQIITSLADTNDFYLAGVKPSVILSDIRFKLDISGGNGKIILTTNDPIREPFLNFLIEVNWPSGRLVREYTVLLDPPVFTADDLAPQAQPVAPVAQSSKSTAPQSAVAKQPMSSTSTGRLVAGPGEYHVSNDDTLWQIALKTRPDSSISPQQMMLAIQRANPNAFFDNNINRLKSGSVLTIPSKDQIVNTSLSDSVQEVKRQNSSWKGAPAAAKTASSKVETAKADGAKLDAAKKPMAKSDSAPVDNAQLRIVSKSDQASVEAKAPDTVASEQPEATSVADSPVVTEMLAKNEQLEEQLVVTLEGLDKVERDNAEMFERLDRLSEQMESMARLVELKDQQLAQLQGQLAQKQTAAVAPQAPQPSLMESLPMGIIGGALAALLALLVGMMVFVKGRKKDQDDDSLVTLNEQSGSGEVAPVAAAAAVAEALPEASENVASDATGVAEIDTAELDDITFDEDLDDPFNMSTDNNDEFDTISDAELDSALGNDLDMDLKLDEPIAEDSEMEAFSNSLLNDDEYDLSTGLDEDEDASVAELDDDFGSDLDTLLSEDGADGVQGSDAEALSDELDDGFGSDLDDLLAESESEIEIEVDEEPELTLDELLSPDSNKQVELDEVDEGIPDDDAFDALLSEAESEVVAESASVEFDSLVDSGEEMELGSLEVDALPGQELDVSTPIDDMVSEFELDDELASVDGAVDDVVTDTDSPFEFELDDGADDGADDALNFVVAGGAAGAAAAALSDSNAGAEVAAPKSALTLDDGLDDAADSELEAELEQMLGAEDNALSLQETELEGDEVNYLDSADEVGTKIDLARAYIDMDDDAGARDILHEVISEGSAEQIAEATQLLESMKG
ncbi:MAG: FimV/HubP family polar landmark protein [Motiliproteus sp.]